MRSLWVDTHGGADRHSSSDRQYKLLWDVVRVVTRLVRRLAKALELIDELARQVLRPHTLSAAAADVRWIQRHDDEAASPSSRPTRTGRSKSIDIAEEVVGKRTRGAREDPHGCAARTCS